MTFKYIVVAELHDLHDRVLESHSLGPYHAHSAAEEDVMKLNAANVLGGKVHAWVEELIPANQCPYMLKPAETVKFGEE